MTFSKQGELVQFLSAGEAKINSCKVYFSPKQAGTGDPSPDNVRGISGTNGVDIYHARKNIGHIFGYSAQNGQSIGSQLMPTNSYGTEINITEFNGPDTPLVITQTKYPTAGTPNSYNNGYLAIYVDNLIYEEYYDVSFRVSDITNDPLNAVDKISLLNPRGIQKSVSEIKDGVYIYRNI